MLKYAKITNQETKQCDVGLGTNVKFYKSIGMVEMDVEQAYNGSWYIVGYVPEKPAPTEEEQRQARANAYLQEVDPITAHIQRLRDEDGQEEKIAELIEQRKQKVDEIKQLYPYPVEEINSSNNMLTETESKVIKNGL